MTDRTSCIQHPPDTPMVIIRLDYLALCEGYKHAKCAAALLNMFERWHNYKLHQRSEVKMRRKPARKRKQVNGLWVYMSQADIHRELFEVFGLNMVGDALRELVKCGYVQERQNPNLKRDRTKQYLFLVDAVQRAVDNFKQRWTATRKAVELCESGVRPFFKFKECKLYSQRLETLVLKFRCFKTKEALPLNTELTPKLKSTEREAAQSAESTPAPSPSPLTPLEEIPEPSPQAAVTTPDPIPPVPATPFPRDSSPHPIGIVRQYQPDAFTLQNTPDPIINAFLSCFTGGAKNRGLMSNSNARETAKRIAEYFTTEDVIALVTEKRKVKPAYPFSFLEADLAEMAAKRQASSAAAPLEPAAYIPPPETWIGADEADELDAMLGKLASGF